MSWFRVTLLGLALMATAARAQEARQAAIEARTGVWRRLEVPRGDETASAEPVPELHVAPGSATLLELPERIVPGDGFKVVGGEGRVDAKQVSPTMIVLVTSRVVAPERIPLAVATIDGHRYPFLLATRPGVVDIQVRVAFAEEFRAAHGEDALIDALMNGDRVFSRQYQRQKGTAWASKDESGWEVPFVDSAVRMGSRYFIRVTNRSDQPWKVDQAKLEGAGGDLLKVTALRWAVSQTLEGGKANRNIIVAEVPEGAGADYALKSIELVGQDARIASLDQAVSLP